MWAQPPASANRMTAVRKLAVYLVTFYSFRGVGRTTDEQAGRS